MISKITQPSGIVQSGQFSRKPERNTFSREEGSLDSPEPQATSPLSPTDTAGYSPEGTWNQRTLRDSYDAGDTSDVSISAAKVIEES